ncbi:uncharacterized protein LOC114938306 isoform X2 [Nylanderia fulva]|uniref:uncharacterized protein LOC114938306 isoform X2 n=1 Tax=Nylanderia fulva TaxID=613905 RepID=UPI0010FB312F|nr:uncharacterized protein LOC114938306 isoform X2 [Nylanderia fulva]
MEVDNDNSINSEELLTSMHDNKGAKFYIPDVQTELCYELYQFVGLRCREFNEDSRLVFEICSTEQNLTENDMYAVEILINENGCGKLGKWVLPISF